jgi:hypothetical protein
VALGGVAEPGEELRRAIGEDDRGLSAGGHEETVLHPLAGQDRCQTEDDAGDRDARPDSGLGRGGSNELGGGGLADGQGRGQGVAARERRGHCERRARPLLRVRIEATQDGALRRRIEVVDVARGPARQPGRALVERLRHGVRGERAAAGEQLVEHETERVDVTPDGRLAAGELLRRHIGRGALAGRRALDCGRPPSQTEVGDPRAPAAVDHHVRRLEVPVNDPLLVGRGEPGADLPRELRGLLTRQPADPEEQRREILAVHVLHRDEVLSLGLSDVVHAADVGVRHPARVAHLVEQQGKQLGILHELGRQELEGHRLSELEVVGAVDLAHAAPAQQAAHPVPLGDDRAGDVALGRRLRDPATAAGARGHGPSRPAEIGGRVGAGRGLASIAAARGDAQVAAALRTATGIGSGRPPAPRAVHEGGLYLSDRGHEPMGDERSFAHTPIGPLDLRVLRSSPDLAVNTLGG